MSTNSDSKKFKKELKLFLLATLVFPPISLILMVVIPLLYLEFKYPDFEDNHAAKITNIDTNKLSTSRDLLSK